MEDISTILEKNLEGILERGESIEIDLLENTVIEGREPDSCVVVDSCLEKIDPKRLKWRTRPFVAPESIWEDDKTFYVGEIKTPWSSSTHFLILS